MTRVTGSKVCYWWVTHQFGGQGDGHQVKIQHEDALASSKDHIQKESLVLLAHHITVDHVLPLLLFSAGAAIFVADVRARERNDRQAKLQHAAFELGLQVALDRTPVSA